MSIQHDTGAALAAPFVSACALRDVAPAQPAAGYIGGKRNLAKRLITRIEAIPHDGYAEAFVGMGGVFLRRGRAARVEVINDRSGHVANFFRTLQRHYPRFMGLSTLSGLGTPRVRAAEGKPARDADRPQPGRSVSLPPAPGLRREGRRTNLRGFAHCEAGFDIHKLGPILEKVHERLAGVSIECLDWAAFIQRYDRPSMLFYLDPPYSGCEDDYGKEAFARDQFAQMAQVLQTLKGRFLLSLKDRPEVRAIFAAFPMEAVGTTYTVSAGQAQKVGELIIGS